MPIYLDAILSFALGIAWCNRFRDRPDFFTSRLSWPLVAQLAFQCVVLTPLQAFSFRFHHDWSTAYIIDPERHPKFDQYLGTWSLVAAIVLTLLAFAGHVVGRVVYEKPRSHAPRNGLAVCAVLTIAAVAVFYRELAYLGTYEEFSTGVARLFLATPVLVPLIIELVATAAFVIQGPRLLARIPKEQAELT